MILGTSFSVEVVRAIAMERIILRMTCPVVLARVFKAFVLILALFPGITIVAMAYVPVISQILANTKTLTRTGVAWIKSVAEGSKETLLTRAFNVSIR